MYALTQAGEPHPSASALGPPRGTSPCLCHPRRALEASGGRTRPPAPQLPSPSSGVPRSHCTRLPHLQRQRPPVSPAPVELPRATLAAALASCPLPFTHRVPRRAWRPRLLFPRREGREEEGTQWVGRAGRAKGVRSLPSGARLDPA